MAKKEQERSWILLQALFTKHIYMNIIQKVSVCKEQIIWWTSMWIFCLFPKSDFQNTFSVNELVSFTSCHNHSFMFSNGAHKKESRINYASCNHL